MSDTVVVGKGTGQAPAATAVDGAFEFLKTYDQGSGRAGLLPLDQAVAAAQTQPAARKELEQRLLSALKTCKGTVGREYICSKLAWIGSDASVPVLAGLLGDAQLVAAARQALEAIPGRQASKALREHVSKLIGQEKIGVINSIGERRDADSLRLLTKLLKETNADIASAAAAAIGNVGTARAGKVLRAYLPKAPEALRPKLADPILTCAERLLVVGRGPEAAALYQSLAASAQPAHIQTAVARGLKACGA